MINVPNVKVVNCKQDHNDTQCTIYGRSTHKVTSEYGEIISKGNSVIKRENDGFKLEFESGRATCKYDENYPGNADHIICEEVEDHRTSY